MTSHPSGRPASALRVRMIEAMNVHGFSEKTRNDYIRNVRAFAAFIGRSLGREEELWIAPPPVSLTASLALPRTPGRSTGVFVDGDLEVRFAARPTNGPQIPLQRDELYFIAAGTGRYRSKTR